MATGNRISQNKPFNCAPNYRRSAGPISYSWCPTEFEKKGGRSNNRSRITCQDQIDNIVTYVYNILPDGNHSAYVTCDYVL